MADVTKTRNEVIVLSGLLIAGGLALVLSGLKKGSGGGGGNDQFGRLAGILPGESMGDPLVDGFGVGVVPLQIGQRLGVLNPTVAYAGPGRDTFTYFRIVQRIGPFGADQWQTVYASGVAGVRIGPASSVQVFPLVSPTQEQPPGCPAQSLCVFPWVQGQDPNFPPGWGICGAPPRLGAATALLEIYQRTGPEDADGFAEPTCNGRVPVRRSVWFDAVLFT